MQKQFYDLLMMASYEYLNDRDPDTIILYKLLDMLSK